MERICLPQIGVTVAEAGMELERQLLFLGDLQGQVQQIVAQGLAIQAQAGRPG